MTSISLINVDMRVLFKLPVKNVCLDESDNHKYNGHYPVASDDAAYHLPMSRHMVLFAFVTLRD